jgi:DNA-binding transcriptional MerR regulator
MERANMPLQAQEQRALGGSLTLYGKIEPTYTGAPPIRGLQMPRGRIKARSGAPYRIKDLTEITGTSKEAVRFYIRQGLLPPPVKTAHNMGWYSDRHVELLRFIQKLQTEQFLPLKAIRALLRGDRGIDFTEAQAQAFEAMRRKIAGENRDLVVSDDPGKLAQQVGLSRWEQKGLSQLGLAAEGTVSISDIEISRQWIAIRDAGFSLERGFSPANLEYIKDLAEIALRNEVQLLRRLVRDFDSQEYARIIDIALPAVNRLFALFHERQVEAFLEEMSLKLPQLSSVRKRKAATPAAARKQTAAPKEYKSGSKLAAAGFAARAGRESLPAAAKAAHRAAGKNPAGKIGQRGRNTA